MSDDINIFIAMPIYRQMLYIQTLSSLMALKDNFAERGIKSSFSYIDSYDVVQARNMLATYFVRNKQYTHLLFIDDDMLFDPENIIDLLLKDKPFTACVCPKRGMNLENIYKMGQQGKTVQESIASSLNFVLSHPQGQSVSIEQNFCRLKSIGMAVTLLRRDVFSTMIENNCVSENQLQSDMIADAFGNPYHYGFFDRIYSDELRGWFGEDFSFCRRWTETCAGEIFGLVTAKIGHVGIFVYEGRYLESLQAGKP